MATDKNDGQFLPGLIFKSETSTYHLSQGERASETRLRSDT